MIASGVESLICPDGQLECGSVGCYDPTIQGCIENNGGLECLNSCNGACYSNAQYCYNNKIICNSNQLVCDIESLTNPTCYDPGRYGCYNNGICEHYLSCGAQCVNDYYIACANNQTLCPGFDAWDYYVDVDFVGRLDTCGPQQNCYDKALSVCLNGTTICQGTNAQLCGTICFNPDIYICVNDIIQCLNSCNGACYSNAQYCYNNKIICNSNQLVCDIESLTNPTCYDPGSIRLL